MKFRKIISLLLTVLMCVGVALMLPACIFTKDPVVTTTPPKTEASLTISNKISNMELGSEHPLVIKKDNIPTDEYISITSSDPSVISVENGILKANAIGIATITVSAEDVADFFDVSVVNRVSPSIGVDAQPGNQFEGATFQLVPYISYSADENSAPSKYYDDIIFSYESSNEAVATVSELGLITAMSQGETVITISATYNYQTAIRSYVLTVVDGDALTLDKSALTLVTSDSEKREATLVAFGYKNNQSIENDELIWSIESGDGIISLSNGVVTALKYGTAQVKVSHSDDASLYATCTITVTRGDAIITDVEIELDRRNEQNLDSLFLDKLEDIDASEIISVTDVNGNDLLSEGKLNGSLLVADPYNLTTLLIGTDTTVYAVSARVWSLLIATADDLKTADGMLTWDGKLAYGYFKLVNDIDMSGVDWNCDLQIGYLEDNDFAYYDGFAGEFDGNGKTIKNLTTSEKQYNGAPHGGLFYELANGSYIHDVSFTDVVIKSHKSGVIASAVMGGKLENINISIKDVHQGYAGVGTSAILGNMLSADYYGTVTVKNVVVDLTGVADIASKSFFGAIGYVHNSIDLSGLADYKEKVLLEDISIIGSSQLFVYGKGDIISDTTTLGEYFTIVDNSVKLYANMSDYNNGTQIEEFTVSFDSAGGTEVTPQTVLIGEKATKPADPTRESDEEYIYAFAGWFVNDGDNDASNDIEWNFETDSVNENIELVAHWTGTPNIQPPNTDDLVANIVYDADQSTGIDFAVAIGSEYGVLEAIFASDGVTQVAHVGGVVTYTLEEASDIAETYYVTTDTDAVIKVDVIKWSQLIYTADDMKNLGQYEYSPESNIYISYIKFMADIDMTGVTYANSTPIGHNAPCYGFFGWQGVIEGNGKTVTGFNSSENGEFISRMGKGAVLRNLNFADAVVGGGNRALLCNFLGGGTIQNVYISVSTGYDGSFNFKTSVIAKEIPYGNNYWNDECIITLEDVTVVRSNTNSTDTKQAALVCLTSGDYSSLSLDQLKSRLILNNVKVSGFSAFICDFITGNEETAVGVVNGDNIGNYATVDESSDFAYVP